MTQLRISRVELASPQEIGMLSTNNGAFTYSQAYLSSPSPVPLSASLPLQSQPFPEHAARPYFEGLLAEGPARAQLAGTLGIREDDYLSLLEACGKDCIGDILVSRQPPTASRGEYRPLTLDDMRNLLSDSASLAENNAALRLSLAGTQGKTGLAHLPGHTSDSGWLEPSGIAATTHILKTSRMRDVPENEYLCMKAAAACGIETPHVELMDFPLPTLTVERFDRKARLDANGRLSVARIHQEDLAQALGVPSASKYAEVEEGTIPAIARFLKHRSVQPARDVAAFARTLCFAYAIGDCDAHLKNYSVLIQDAAHGVYRAKLAPAYDFVCTTVFPRFSRTLAMAIGGEREIDDVKPSTFNLLASDLGITKAALRALAMPIAESLTKAINAAGNGHTGAVLASTPYIADNLAEDFAPRIEVLRAFCER